jgi:prepilin-type N-terminal cleavage/methylation domain-containing protein
MIANAIRRRGRPNYLHGFTLGFSLIELLIVMAIIGILASIAIPNYQDALTRSKCAKFMGDCQAVQTAVELYYADHSEYPPEDRYPVGSTNRSYSDRPPYPATGFLSRTLTTPVAYIAKLPIDPFRNHNPAYEKNQFPERRPYNYSNDMKNTQYYKGSTNQYYVSWIYQYLTTPQGNLVRNASNRPNAAIWMINSPGPDGDRDHGWDSQWVDNTSKPVVDSQTENEPILYDPTNGTLSNGDLYMFGPGLGFPNQ